MIRGDAPAFPGNEAGYAQSLAGLTKRELFAAFAMQGLLSNGPTLDAIIKVCDRDPKTIASGVAMYALMHADALIERFDMEAR
jgi:hypothetical protein